MSKVPGKRAERKHEVRDEAAVQLAMADMDARVEPSESAEKGEPAAREPELVALRDVPLTPLGAEVAIDE